ncbi:MAG: sigma-70 family RNA polymerase sigma factor [Acidobacteria bacterium]|uniref:Sigma-70 family RNA polymerase sigma factor n=1 Tax=Candidatus Polarisedimenticola svalbardensis TaxID=2886004 RepID=A0A8J6XXQ6_9BACT|nr:sigma-70 family RNA polymerase sigma factor [Candidatus Polarisedimenticola svalbardensis]
MSSDDPAPLDPAVLADPVDNSNPEPEVKALVPAGGRGLAPVDPLRAYMAELRKYPPLNREEEQEMARRYRETGDREALFRLITANLMLVVRVAQSFRRAARNVLDLIQEGNIGLMQAVEKFDPEMGYRLPTYASWWIRAYMVKFLLDNVRLVRVGTTNARRKLLHNLEKEKRKLEAAGYEVGPKLLAEKFGVSEQDVTDVQMALGSHDLMLDAPAGGDEDGRSHGDTLAGREPDAETQMARKQLQDRVEAALDRFREGMSERDLMILNDRILSDEPLKLQEIGDRFGTSREAARQAEVRIKGRLKTFLLEEMGDVGNIRFQ